MVSKSLAGLRSLLVEIYPPNLAEEGLAIAREIGDVHTMTFSLTAHGFAALEAGQYGIAKTQLRQGLTLCRQLGDLLGVDHLPQCRVRCLDGHGGTGHFDAAVYRSWV